MDKIDFSRPLVSLDGQELKGEDGKIITLAEVSAQALLSMYDDEKNISAEEKIKRYKLAHKVFSGEELEISSDEASLIRKVANKRYAPLILGQIYELIK